MNQTDIGDGLRALADRHGVSLAYTDNSGTDRPVPAATVAACLRAMGVDPAGPADGPARRLPPWIVAEVGTCPDLSVAGAWRITGEDGDSCTGQGPLPDLPLGRHRLETGEEVVWILSAPAALDLPDPGWGVTLPLYGLRTAADGGLGDYDDLGRAAESLGRAGAAFLGINPVHAGSGFGAGPVSPYSPSHRRRLSVTHIPAGGERTEPGADLIDYPAALGARSEALEAAFREAEDLADFDRWAAAEGADLRQFALYGALSEAFGPDWSAWPDAYRAPSGPAVRDFATTRADRVRFHAWLQYRAERALGRAAARARGAGMRHGLYLDLAVGTLPHGAETWAERGAFAQGVSLGAPPDAFAPDGQNWSLAPFNPRHLVATGFQALADTLRCQLRHAGMLRIDHILGVERAFWVPEGGLPGTYVAMPKAAMLAVIRIEAARAGAVIVGEDLGNIPDGLRTDLSASRILGCDVAMFRGEDPPGAYRDAALASFGTHDLPPWEAWRTGRDITARVQAGLMTADGARAARAQREAEVRAFPATDLDGMHRHLARSRSRLVALQIEDILGLADQPNLPGTVDEYPNWRRRVPVAAAELGRDPRLLRAARIMAEAGR